MNIVIFVTLVPSRLHIKMCYIVLLILLIKNNITLSRFSLFGNTPVNVGVLLMTSDLTNDI